MFKIVDYWGTCKCISGPRSIKNAIKDLYNELFTFVVHPSQSDISEIMFRFGRFLGSIINKPYVSVPGDELALDRIRERIMTYKCVRRREHLINGRCPSE